MQRWLGGHSTSVFSGVSPHTPPGAATTRAALGASAGPGLPPPNRRSNASQPNGTVNAATTITRTIDSAISAAALYGCDGSWATDYAACYGFPMAADRTFLLLLAFAAVASGCGAVESSEAAVADSSTPDTARPESAVGASCIGATTGTYACGGTARACDPSRPPGLPTGACTAGESCELIVRPANCDCLEDDGPRYPWSCSCVAGAWSCTALPPDARICGCMLNPPYAASCEPVKGPSGVDEHRWIGLEPYNGFRGAGFGAAVTLQGSSAPDAALKAAVVNGIRLYSYSIGAWVRAEVGAATGDDKFLKWTVEPPKGFPRGGDWALRVGPLPASASVGWVDAPNVYCGGVMETHFTVLAP